MARKAGNTGSFFAWRQLLLIVTMLWSAGASAADASAEALPPLGVATGVTVSGLSSGAYMAAQYAVAFSKEVQGVGVVAGGPWDCAQGRIDLATTACSCVTAVCNPVTPYVLAFQSAIRASARADLGQIDPLGELKKQRVWLFSGQRDHTVPTSNVDAVEMFYKDRMHTPAAQIKSVHRADAGHGLPVVGQPAALACSLSEPPYLNNCQLDAAKEILGWLYPGRPLKPGRVAAGELREFDQRPYLQDLAYTGLADTGFVYIPAACQAAQANCAVHVVFHGCRQSRESTNDERKVVGASFVERAGYNRWASGSRLVVLYPQIKPVDTGAPLVTYQYNPRGCWDFWGYTQPLGIVPAHVTNKAPQMQAVRAMVAALQRHQ